MPLLGRLLEPPGGFGTVSGDALPTGVHQAEVVLHHRIPLLSRLIKPLLGLLLVAGHSAALRIEDSEGELSARLALLGGGPLPLARFLHVDPAALTRCVILSQRDLGADVSRPRIGFNGLDI